jgi:hypothetical protein
MLVLPFEWLIAPRAAASPFACTDNTNAELSLTRFAQNSVCVARGIWFVPIPAIAQHAAVGLTEHGINEGTAVSPMRNIKLQVVLSFCLIKL